MPKTQIIFIHGGNTFDNREQYYAYLEKLEYDPYEAESARWSHTIQEYIGDDYEIFRPEMPASDDADYNAWKIWFEKLFPFLHDGKIILI
jgi:hypothetical protein